MGWRFVGIDTVERSTRLGASLRYDPSQRIAVHLYRRRKKLLGVSCAANATVKTGIHEETFYGHLMRSAGNGVGEFTQVIAPRNRGSDKIPPLSVLAD